MAYFPQNLPEFNYLRHMQLVYVGPQMTLDPSDIAHHIAHFDAQGNPDDWFFDSFLVIPPLAPSHNAFHADVNLGTTRCGAGDFYAVPSPNPATAQDWMQGLEAQLAPEGCLAVMDRTIGELASRIGKAPAHKHNVVLTIPYPHPNQSIFGRTAPNHARLNFSVLGQDLIKASLQRLEACKWFVDEAMARFKKGKFKNLNLLGFYWVYESIHYSWEIDDHWLLKELHGYIRQKRSRFFWIPFYSSFNVHMLQNYQKLYFDCAFLQPNHMFYYPIKDVEQAAREAEERGAGIEMEYYLNMDPTFSVGEEKYQRFRNYLNGGIKYGYMTRSACAYYLGGYELHKMAASDDPRERDFYDDIYHFVKGDYQEK